MLEIGKPCENCGHCCSFGSGFLVDEDIAPLAKFLGISEEELKKNQLETVEKFHTTRWRPKLLRKDGMPYGPCIFLDENKRCKVHPVKPLQCRIYSRPSGQGVELNSYFMIKYFVNVDDPQSVREYAQYLQNGGATIDGAELETLVPDKKRLQKILNYEE